MAKERRGKGKRRKRVYIGTAAFCVFFFGGAFGVLAHFPYLIFEQDFFGVRLRSFARIMEPSRGRVDQRQERGPGAEKD
ncbi:MAG: hypothetical protein IIW01_07850, partial [Thermoguttaceae bacterium]|nr:hypothetical protein [Thermoguttaceae bacterium]